MVVDLPAGPCLAIKDRAVAAMAFPQRRVRLPRQLHLQLGDVNFDLLVARPDQPTVSKGYSWLLHVTYGSLPFSLLVLHGYRMLLMVQ